MTSGLIKDWLDCVWNRRLGAIQQKRSMLVSDAFKSHLKEDAKDKVKSLRSDFVIIPGGMTSFLQVLVFKPLKGYLIELYSS